MQGRGEEKGVRPIRGSRHSTGNPAAGHPWSPRGGDTVLSRAVTAREPLRVTLGSELPRWLRPSRRESPANPAELPQTPSCSTRLRLNLHPARKVLLPLTHPLNWLLTFSVVPAGLQPGQSQPDWNQSQQPSARRQSCHQNVP